MDNFWLNALWSITPTVILGLLFWLIIRSILRSDRTERETYAKLEAEERAKRGLSDNTQSGAQQ
jgi:cytochrome c-type biogenesis protein CcmH/NrfF